MCFWSVPCWSSIDFVRIVFELILGRFGSRFWDHVGGLWRIRFDYFLGRFGWFACASVCMFVHACVGKGVCVCLLLAARTHLLPRAAKSSPRAAKSTPRAPQERLKSGQERPGAGKRCQERLNNSKDLQEGPWEAYKKHKEKQTKKCSNAPLSVHS